MSKLFAKFYALNFTDEDLSALGNGYTGQLCNLSSRLTNDFSVECAVDDNGLTNLFGFLGIEEVASASSELFLNRIVDALENDNRLLSKVLE